MQNSKNKILSGNLINEEMAHYEHLSGNNLNTEHFLFGQIANSKQKLTLDLPSSETSFSKLFEHFQNSMNVFDDKSKNRQLFLKTIEHFHSFYRISRKYSAIERSKQIELKKLDFQTFFNRLHHHFRQFIETDHYKFDFTSEIRDYFPIMGHPESLKTLIYELLRNAKNASKTGSIVTLSANIAFAETISHLNVQKLKGKYICIKISDKGSGMSTSELALSTKDYYSGNPERNHSGLGLSLCQSIVESHKGSMHIFSRKGQGTQVYCYFPYQEDTQAIIQDPENEIIQGSLHILMTNYKLCRFLHLNLAEHQVRANYSTLMHEFIHLNDQEAIYPVALIIQPSIINRAKTDQIMYMSDLNKKIPFILMDSRTEKLSRNIKKEFSNIKTIPYPFVISELVELMKKMEIPERKRPYRRRYGKRRDVNGNLKE